MSGEAVDVTLSGVSKRYGTVAAVREVSLDVRAGEIVSLLGPSGCGKTTTLRMIAGLERLDSGAIRIGGAEVSSLPPWRRKIGMVFQNYALFPHMTVYENVAFGLAMRGFGQEEIRREVAHVLALVKLAGLEERRPSQLSGGQRQRVAFARAIVTRPLVLLLDEPLAALDKKLREQMQVEIKELQRTVNVTTIFVTHDQEEALAISDRLVVMEAGEVVQIGTPREVYERPRTRFVADFIGLSNRFAGRLRRSDGGWAQVQTAIGPVFKVPAPATGQTGDMVEIVIRPERVSMRSRAMTPAVDSTEGIVTGAVFNGAVTYYQVSIGQGIMSVTTFNEDDEGRHANVSVGTRVVLTWRCDDVRVFRSDDGDGTGKLTGMSSTP